MCADSRDASKANDGFRFSLFLFFFVCLFESVFFYFECSMYLNVFESCVLNVFECVVYYVCFNVTFVLCMLFLYYLFFNYLNFLKRKNEI